jgi:3-isopropylmalate/(R)-2-methylmalate dehydratase small subunit
LFEAKLKVKAWVGGDDISTYAIIPQRHWDLDALDPVVLGRWAMEGADPAFKEKENAFAASGFTAIVAGENFGGGGKSMEHPIIALKGAGVKIVLADSFGRYNFRNSVNNGLPVVECRGFSSMVATGDELTVDLTEGHALNQRTGQKMSLVPFSRYMLDIMEAGGLIEYTKAKIAGK